MKLTYQQVGSLLAQVAAARPDELGCEGCFQLMAEFADAELQGITPSAALEAVQTHLQQCPCCAYEYEALLEGLSVLGDS